MFVFPSRFSPILQHWNSDLRTWDLAAPTIDASSSLRLPHLTNLWQWREEEAMTWRSLWWRPLISTLWDHCIGPTVDMLQNRRLSASIRTEPKFLASESFPWLWDVSKWLVEPLSMLLPILLMFGMSFQKVMPLIRNLRKFSLFHRQAGLRHQNYRSWSVETTHDTFFY